ncbi:MAG: hypothetical protein JSU81_04840 [Candidatus Coatesbacteria bacterium]|nr:MAG: hypothetical protein JSU81_04840 [Candidatus Coatesbacteria bacterium]
MKPLAALIMLLTLTASLTLAEEGPVEEKAEFPETEWEEMRALMEKKGADAVIEFVAGFDDEQRRQLYSLAQRGFAYRDWEGKNLDDLATVVQAGIAEGLRQARAETDAAKAAKLLDYANVLSYNLAADLAECWPGDTLPRDKRHFEAGLKAAADCLRWREELGKGPFPFSIAYWAHGMHLLSLGETHAALEDFRKSYKFAVEFAKAEGKDTSLSAEGEFGVLLAAGYVGLAEWVLGEDAEKAHYEEAISAFKEGAEKYPDKKDDFQFGIDQLEWVKGKFIK